MLASSACSSLDRRATAAAAADAPWPPVMEERYERLEKLGEGIFGRVYKTRDRADGQIVAVKQLSGSGGGAFVETGFLDLAREVTSLSRCRGHPSIVEFRHVHPDTRDTVGDGGDCFIVMEYAGRMNLRTYLVSRGIHGMLFREAEVRGIMRQLLDAVEGAHRMGILHRDVKPENVVVGDAAADMIRNPPPPDDDEDGDGRRRRRRKKKKNKQRRPPPPEEEIACKVCDFGSSEPVAAVASGRREYSPLATSGPYRAPELFLGSADYDGRIDTWGLGCIMAELLVGTGAAFLQGKTEENVLGNMLEVVGAAGIKDWLGRPFQPGSAGGSAAEERARSCPEAGRLREVFPEKVLSPAGFEVLSGLLESSPGDRLTAAEALQKPWFAEEDTEERRRGGPRRRGLLGACLMSCATND